ncbi:MAG: helix-turn-helix domain-containing protein [Oscillospiraceae bacterium]|nr:helix-turn-helix domain-containing protein [Oscillospiraceae bacterium]
MSTERTREILQQISVLLNSLNESETEPKETKQEKVEMLTVRECSEVIKGLNEYTVRQLIARKEIPSVRTGQGKNGKILVPKAALVAYFNGGGKV